MTKKSHIPPHEGTHGKNEPLFELIRSMDKAEKRNFKLWAGRLDGNRGAKYLALFDALDGAERYDEARILARCPITREQLPNVKAHLYRQILVSIRLLAVQRDEVMQMHEQLDFARILYDKGLYRQSGRMAERARESAMELEAFGPAIEAADFRTKLDRGDMRGAMGSVAGAGRGGLDAIFSQIETVNDLATTTSRAYSLYRQLGYARSEKDRDLIVQYFKPRLDKYRGRDMSFNERLHYYQAMSLYHYIQHDFVSSYAYSRRWTDLFETRPRLREAMYDSYIRGCAQVLEGLYLMRKYHLYRKFLALYAGELRKLSRLGTNAYVAAHRVIYTNLVHKAFMEGDFAGGLAHLPVIEEFMHDYAQQLDRHFVDLMNYKIACLYFGVGDHARSMEYLARVTARRDVHTSRDLQCFARILHLVASYEAGMDYNLDAQVRSVYSFLIKMNDMQSVQRELLSFLRRVGSIYADRWKEELTVLHNRLKPYETHPWERRAFYYFDVLSWLESKITGRSVAEVARRKFNAMVGK